MILVKTAQRYKKNATLTLFFYKTFFRFRKKAYFCIVFTAAPANCGPTGVEAYIWEKALLDALCLTYRNLAVPKTSQETKQQWRPCMCIIRTQWGLVSLSATNLLVELTIYISAWASALLVLTCWAMPEPLYVGRVTCRLPRLFFVYQQPLL